MYSEETSQVQMDIVIDTTYKNDIDRERKWPREGFKVPRVLGIPFLGSLKLGERAVRPL